MNMHEQATFEPETQIKIGAVTYIVAAHFDDTREDLKAKINRLLRNDVNRCLSEQMRGLSQSDVV